MQLGCLILAAGEGKRMRSALAKPLHQVCGRPMIAHVLEYCRAPRPELVCVVLGVAREAVAEALAGQSVRTVVQHEQLGTGHAVMAAAEVFADFPGDLIITCADIPLVRPETLQALLAEHRAREAAGTVLTAIYPDPAGYGRVVRDAQGLVSAIVEHRDADDEVRVLREINAGVYCFNARKLYAALSRLQPENEQGEYYLTDVMAELVAQGEKVAAVIAEDPAEAMGINDRVQLALAETKARERVRERLMRDGVTMIDPAATYVDAGVRIGQDTVLWPGTVITGATTIGAGCTIGPNAQIDSCVIGDGAVIRPGSVLTSSTFGRKVTVGPYSHVRADCQVGDEARVGSYSELVRTKLGRGVKDNHFSYLGDTEVGADSNIGAGTVTCNYDGKYKHKTIIGRDAFIGSDSVLVAPVTIGDGAYTAAGSVITADVPPESLGIGRARQETVANWARRQRDDRRRRT